MPPMTTVPRTRRETAPEPEAIQSGTQPRMNAKAVIRIGRNRILAPVSAASAMLLPFLVFALGEFDDQNGVFGREANQHDEADLSVNIVLEVTQPKCQHKRRRRRWECPAAR